MGGDPMTAAGRLERLRSAHLAARAADRPVTPEEVCRDHPGLLLELRRRIAVADAVNRLATPRTDVSGPRPIPNVVHRPDSRTGSVATSSPAS